MTTGKDDRGMRTGEWFFGLGRGSTKECGQGNGFGFLAFYSSVRIPLSLITKLELIADEQHLSELGERTLQGGSGRRWGAVHEAQRHLGFVGFGAA